MIIDVEALPIAGPVAPLGIPIPEINRQNGRKAGMEAHWNYAF